MGSPLGMETDDRDHPDAETAGRKRGCGQDQQRGREVAPICASMLKATRKDVTGPIFAVRMNEIFLRAVAPAALSSHRAEDGRPRHTTEHGLAGRGE